MDNKRQVQRHNFDTISPGFHRQSERGLPALRSLHTYDTTTINAPASTSGELKEEANTRIERKETWGSNISKHHAWRRLYRAARQGDCKEIKTCLAHGAKADEIYQGTYALYEATQASTADAFIFLLGESLNHNLRDCMYDGHYAVNWRKEYFVGEKNPNRLRLLTRVVLASWRDHQKKLKVIDNLVKADLGYIHPIVLTVIADDVVALQQQWAYVSTQPIGSQKGITLLQYAAANNSLAVANWLLQQSELVSERKNSLGNTPLIFAAANGYLSMCQLLLSHGALANESNYSGETALLSAACFGSIPVARLLLGSGASIAECDNLNKTALHYAAEHGHLNAVKYFVESGAQLDECDAENWRALHYAAKGGHAVVMLWLLENGVELADEENNSSLALSLAFKYGHFAIIQILLSHHITFDQKINLSYIFVLAAQAGRLDIMKLLASKGFLSGEGRRWITRKYCGETALLAAAIIGHLPMIEWLLKNGSKVTESFYDNSANCSGQTCGATALMLAAKYGHQIVVDYLLANGFQVSDTSYYHKTALLFAIEGGHLPLAQHLYEHYGAQLDVESKNGITALHLAAEIGDLEAVQWLISHGLDPKAITKYSYDHTVVDYAGRRGHLQIIRWLFTYDNQLIETLGSRALYWSAKYGDRECLEWLFSVGTRFVSDRPGKTPFLAIIEYGDLGLVQWLFERYQSTENLIMAFERAVKHGHLNVAQWLIEQDVRRITDPHIYQKALSISAKQGHVPVARWLLQARANIYEQITDSSIKTALCFAIENGRLNMVNWLLRQGARKATIKQTTKGNLTLLLIAIDAKQFYMTQLLITWSVPLSAHRDTHTPLFFALEGLANDYKIDWETVELLLGNGYPIDEKYQSTWTRESTDYYYRDSGSTVLHYAIARHDLPRVKWLHSLGASLQVRDVRGNGALLHAALHGRDLSYSIRMTESSRLMSVDTISLFEWLLENGVDIREQNDIGMTAFHLLGNSPRKYERKKQYYYENNIDNRHNATNTLIWLLKNYPEFRSYYGYWAIVCIVRRRNNLNHPNYTVDDIKTIEWLLEEKMQETKFNENCRTEAFLDAVSKGDCDVVTSLFAKGILVTMCCDERTGDHALHAIVPDTGSAHGVPLTNQLIVVLELLFANEAESLLLIPNKLGATALDNVLTRYYLISRNGFIKTSVELKVLLKICEILLDKILDLGITISHQTLLKIHEEKELENMLRKKSVTKLKNVLVQSGNLNPHVLWDITIDYVGNLFDIGVPHKSPTN